MRKLQNSSPEQQQKQQNAQEPATFWTSSDGGWIAIRENQLTPRHTSPARTLFLDTQKRNPCPRIEPPLVDWRPSSLPLRCDDPPASTRQNASTFVSLLCARSHNDIRRYTTLVWVYEPGSKPVFSPIHPPGRPTFVMFQ